jgi:hypothetical protein
MLKLNPSFEGADPQAPATDVSPSVIVAQGILFTCLAITLATAFVAVSLKDVFNIFARGTVRGGAVEGGKKLQRVFLELEERGILYYTLGSLNFLVQFALAFFGLASIIYLWDFDIYAAGATLFCLFITAVFCVPTFAIVVYLHYQRLLQRFLPGLLVEDAHREPHSLEDSNPDFWRENPLFSSPPPEDMAASAGVWLLENDPDFMAATATAAMFSEFQWPLRRSCVAALVQLRRAYEQCVRAPKFDNSTRLKALQSASAYYVLYHTQLIRETAKPPQIWEMKLFPDLPLDLFIHKHSGEWGGYGVFEYLLHTEDRSEPVTSARFLSYIAPYWFCGDSDSTIKSRPSRLEKLDELIDVLENSQAFTPATLTNCMLCVGAAMDFPLNPEDLVRVDKRCVPSSGCRCRN